MGRSQWPGFPSTLDAAVSSVHTCMCTCTHAHTFPARPQLLFQHQDEDAVVTQCWDQQPQGRWNWPQQLFSRGAKLDTFFLHLQILQIFRLNSPRLINWLIAAAQVDKGAETVERFKMSLGFPGMKEFTCRWKITEEKRSLFGERRVQKQRRKRGGLWGDGSKEPGLQSAWEGCMRQPLERVQTLPQSFDTCRGWVGGGL